MAALRARLKFKGKIFEAAVLLHKIFSNVMKVCCSIFRYIYTTSSKEVEKSFTVKLKT